MVGRTDFSRKMPERMVVQREVMVGKVSEWLERAMKGERILVGGRGERRGVMVLREGLESGLLLSSPSSLIRPPTVRPDKGRVWSGSWMCWSMKVST